MRHVIEKTWGWNDEWQRSDFDRRFAVYACSVIEIAREVVGGLMLNRSASAVDLVEIQILPEHQGKGIGTAVVRKVIEDAARDCLPVTLSVVPANSRAKQLYERIGFRVTSVDAPFIHMRYGH